MVFLGLPTIRWGFIKLGTGTILFLPDLFLSPLSLINDKSKEKSFYVNSYTFPRGLHKQS